MKSVTHRPKLGQALSSAGALTRLAAKSLAVLGLALAGCFPFGTPRIQDSSARHDYRSALRSHELCAPEVELVRSIAQANRPYREVANLSAVCYPGVLSECERRLLERACELKADAIILTEAKAGGTPPGGATDSRVSHSALAVRWLQPSDEPSADASSPSR